MIIILKRLGAVPFCRTNLPQSLLAFESSNPIFGITKNPRDLSRSPGGSSGGEGALIGGGGSIMGFGMCKQNNKPHFRQNIKSEQFQVLMLVVAFEFLPHLVESLLLSQPKGAYHSRARHVTVVLLAVLASTIAWGSWADLPKESKTL
jgi:hypothetical protein